MSKKVNNTNKQIKGHNRRLSEVALYDFLRMIKYKSEWYEVKLHTMGQYEASTIICNVCGCKLQKPLPVKIRKWKCVKCGTVHDRDINAAKVIRNETMKEFGLS